jgi:hypothetical protein
MTDARPPLETLLIGAADRPEFAEAVAVLRSLSALRVEPDVEAAVRQFDAGCVPDVVVHVQARPGEIAHDAVERLRRREPLARQVALVGSWCDGEPRSGKPIPGLLRIEWHQSWRLARLLTDIALQERAGAWRLPLTATSDDRLLDDCRPRVPRPLRGLVAVCLSRFDAASAVIDACRSRGYAAVWTPPPTLSHASGVAAVVWEPAEPWDACMDELTAVRARFSQAPIVALVNFPRWHDVQRLPSGGVAAIVAKPLMLDDLFGPLEQAVAAASGPNRSSGRS